MATLSRERWSPVHDLLLAYENTCVVHGHYFRYEPKFRQDNLISLVNVALIVKHNILHRIMDNTFNIYTDILDNKAV